MAASSASAGDSPPPSGPDAAQNNLQHFFILHKASEKSTSSGKPRKRLDLCPTKLKEGDEGCLRMEAFQLVWSGIESSIKDVLRNMNAHVFNQIHSWVCDSFGAIKPIAPFSSPLGPFPIVTHATCCAQLFTALLLTKNMEFVDDFSTFQELGLCLKSHGCHVASLSSLDFSPKNGIAGSLSSLLRQFLIRSFDAADMSILASWYSQHGNYGSPVVVIIDDMERCSIPVLSDFILMLSEWVVKIPVILIMGVATTLDAPSNILPSNVLKKLCPCKFTLGSPAERMDAVVEAALVRQCSSFAVGHKVAMFLRNYFLNQDGTLTSFLRALKIACVQHFSSEPLRLILGGLLVKEDTKGSQNEKVIKCASQVLCHGRDQMAEQTDINIAHGLTELKRLQMLWSTVVLCLYEAGKCDKVQLLDLFCEALDPDVYNSFASDNDNRTGLGKKFVTSLSNDHCMLEQHLSSQKGRLICQVVRKVRDLPAALLCQLLKSWEVLTVNVVEIHDMIKELQSLLKFEEGSCKPDLTDISKRHISHSGKAAILIDCMVRYFMMPIECMHLHEIFCFRNVEKLQSALIGDSRKRIQVDLLEFHKILRCSCCSKIGNIPLSPMPDTSIVYTLAQEHGDLINLHDWFQSFKTIAIQPKRKAKCKLKQSPLPKKRKESNDSENKSEASIHYGRIKIRVTKPNPNFSRLSFSDLVTRCEMQQFPVVVDHIARFCRAITELQITGLIRMPSKKRRDCVQRVAFGL